ncbi:MAG: PAS-domain containing protein [Alphaproteobacteria bacterium]|nr:PAS-domain containing protein [Alphaproteobacteria bacterium]
MSQNLPTRKISLLGRLLGGSASLEYIHAEKSRLEAFLAAFPGEYCGWATDGSIAYSQKFCETLGLESVHTIADLQSRLAPRDAATLENVFERLRTSAIPFTVNCRTRDDKQIFKISGSQGRALEGDDIFNVLWVEDITETQSAYEARLESWAQKDIRLDYLEKAFDSIPQPRWLRDKDGKIVWVNQAYTDAVGHSLEEVLREQKELVTSARKLKGQKTTAPTTQQLAEKAVYEKIPQSCEAHVVIGGRRLLMQIIEMPLPGLDMTLGVTEDISALDDLRNELKRYQFSNKELMEHLRSAIAIYNADERLEFYNSAFSQLWGLEDGWLNTRPKLGEIMEKLRESRRLPEQADFKRFKQSWLDMFTSLIASHEDMLHLPDGSALRMLVIPHSMGGLMMTFEDVTSRLELESSYNTLIAVQKETLDNLGEGVAVYGGNGRLRLCNPAFGRMWGLHPEDLEGEPHISRLVEKVAKFFTKEEWAERKEELTFKALDRMMHEGRLKRADNTLIDFNTVPLPDGGVLVTYTDVTDTVRVENALREKNAALEAAEQLKLDFLANVSYQLRTPLNAIMGFNEILDQEYFGPLNARQKEYTQGTQKASERLLELINDILDLATLEAGYMMLQREEIKIYELMGNIMDLVGDWGRKVGIEIHLHCPKNIGRITADEKRLKQAIINVIRNAINFTPAGGQIDLTARRNKEGLEIEIRDSGIGIGKEDRKRIFEPFKRARSGTGGEPRLGRTGAGLGLALVKNIIALHGGSVDLESEPGKGTTVTIFLPLTSIRTTFHVPIAPIYEDIP